MRFSPCGSVSDSASSTGPDATSPPPTSGLLKATMYLRSPSCCRTK